VNTVSLDTVDTADTVTCDVGEFLKISEMFGEFQCLMIFSTFQLLLASSQHVKYRILIIPNQHDAHDYVSPTPEMIVPLCYFITGHGDNEMMMILCLHCTDLAFSSRTQVHHSGTS
jgi:hypothetical protein